MVLLGTRPPRAGSAKGFRSLERFTFQSCGGTCPNVVSGLSDTRRVPTGAGTTRGSALMRGHTRRGCAEQPRLKPFLVGLLNAPRFGGRGVIQPQSAPESALNAPKSDPKRLKRPYEFSMNHTLKKQKYRSGACGCSIKYHVRESCAWNYVPLPMEYDRSDDQLPYLHSRAVGDRSLILPMQYCAAPLSFVLTVVRGPEARSAVCGRATHTRAVFTG